MLIDRFLKAVLRNKLLVLLGAVLWVLAGVRAMNSLHVDAVPDVTNVQVQILTDSPGLSPLEVEQFVTFPVETAMSGLPQIEEVRSLSRYGMSVVTVVFLEGTDLWWARQLVSERLSAAKGAIPAGVGEPEVGPPSTGLGEVFQFEITAAEGYEDSLDLMDLRDVLEWQIAPRLRAVPGVVEINSFGGELRTWQVEVLPNRLASHGLVLSDLYAALAENHLTVGGGTMERGREQLLVRGTAMLQSLEEVRQVVVATTPEGTPVTVENLANVDYAPMLRQGAVSRDGKGESVIGIAMMGFGENARLVSDDVSSAVEEIRPGLPEGVEIRVFYDRSDLIQRTINTVRNNLLEGGLLVIAVLFLLLGHFRGGLLVALAIPFSMLAAFVGMVMSGVSGNLMSLGAVDFGILIDGAVVMVENVLRVRGRKKKLDDATVHKASSEVARPVLLATMVLILVYLPILGLTGIEGKMFRPMALTIIFALIGALVFALTIVPVLAPRFLGNAEDKETRLVHAARKAYVPALDWALAHPKALGLAALITFGSGVAILPTMGAVFAPRLEEGAIALQLVRPVSVSLPEAIAQGTEIERALLRSFPDEIATVVTRTGRPEIATDPMGVDLSDVFIDLRPVSEWTRADSVAELVELMEHELGDAVPGIGIGFSQPIELRMNELIEGVRSDVALHLYGEDLDKLDQVGGDVVAALSAVEGAQDVKAGKLAGLPMLRVQVDRRAIARLGMDARDVLDAVEALGGKVIGDVLVGQRRYALQVRFPESIRRSPEAFGRVLVGHPSGARVPLSQVADIRMEEGPQTITHRAGQRRQTVEMNVRGRDVASFVAEAKDAIAPVVKGTGMSVEWGGTFKNLEAATGRLAILVPVVLILIFAILQATFRSARLTLLVYANIPIALVGGVFALKLRGLPLSISAAVGFIALFGIAVMNGVVLMTCIRDLHREGMTAFDAARVGASRRLRPVLMTALTDALGFLPMALSTTAGAEVQRPLATVVIGGLVTATLLTLLVLPTWYARSKWPEDPHAAGI